MQSTDVIWCILCRIDKLSKLTKANKSVVNLRVRSVIGGGRRHWNFLSEELSVVPKFPWHCSQHLEGRMVIVRSWFICPIKAEFSATFVASLMVLKDASFVLSGPSYFWELWDCILWFMMSSFYYYWYSLLLFRLNLFFQVKYNITSL